MPTVEIPQWIEEPAGPVFAFDLEELLHLVGDDGARLRWSILDFWGASRDPQLDTMAIEEEVEASETGLLFSWDELVELAEALHQLVDGVIAGYRGAPPSKATSDLRDVSEIVLEAIDSTYWRLYARDPQIIDRFIAAFPNVRSADVERIEPVHRLSG